MGNLISIWGAPNSGKTTLTAKLGKYIYEKHHASVILVFADNSTPVMPLLFPNSKVEDLFSVGNILSKPNITSQDILKNMVTPRNKNNLGVLGYKSGENKYSYPEFNEKKAISFFEALKQMVDFVIVDTVSITGNTLTSASLELSQKTIRLVTPDLNSLVFLSSQLPLYSEPKYKTNKHITVLNRVDESIFYPVQEAACMFDGVRFQIPYTREVKQQFLSGELLQNVTHKKFNEAIKSLSEAVM